MQRKVEFTIGNDVFLLVEKNGKFQVFHNEVKVSEYKELDKANEKLNELANPLFLKWQKENPIK